MHVRGWGEGCVGLAGTATQWPGPLSSHVLDSQGARTGRPQAALPGAVTYWVFQVTFACKWQGPRAPC